MKESLSPQQRARRVQRALEHLYPDAGCPLTHEGPLQLLISTILSARCTDARVNMVTPALFKRFQTVYDFANADLKELQRFIKSTGFFRAKARNIRACCRAMIEQFGGEVPEAMDDLLKLPGVGRKTANVVRGAGFDHPGITVDTHVGRLSRRLGLSTHKDPTKVERDLMNLVPEKHWTRFSLQLIFHGRRVCHARKPRCSECAMNAFCPRVGVTSAA
jgi:endonuclease III